MAVSVSSTEPKTSNLRGTVLPPLTTLTTRLVAVSMSTGE